MRVLFLPDLFTTPEMYKEFADKLNADVHRYRADTLKNRVTEVRGVLYGGKYDIVVGFGAGATIALKAAQKEKLILVNPILEGSITKLSRWFDKAGMDAMRLTNVSSKLLLKFFVRKWSHIKPELVKEFRKCDLNETLHYIDELKAFKEEKIHADNLVGVLLSDEDRICSKEVSESFAKKHGCAATEKMSGGHLIMFDNSYDLIRKLSEVMKRC